MKTAFDGCAREYARARPSYPPRLVTEVRRALRLRSGDTIVDAGAGTGLSSLVFLRAGFRVLPVEPSGPMAREGARYLRENGFVVRYRIAPAERTGLPSSRARAVIAGQAVHWFDTAKALREFHRLLAPGGGLAFFWNNRDGSRSRLLRRYDALIRRWNPAYRRDYRGRYGWGRIVGETGLFERARRVAIPWSAPYTRESFVTFALSVSYVSRALTPSTRPRFVGELSDLIQEEYPSGRFRVPYVTDLWVARRL